MKIKIFVQVKTSLIFAFMGDGIDRLGLSKKLLCFVQVDRKKWDDIAWNQIAEGKDDAINSKEGKGKTENVDKAKMHDDPWAG